MPLYMQKQEQDNDLGDINGIIYNYNIAKNINVNKNK